ncbi:MAG: TIR domain-containing protein [Hyphomicrobiales bacterium]|nr:TIR domain-containing protein [Hyphomicrobiales bacterium]
MPGSDVFISYEKHDRDAARALAEDLTADGFSVWWDRDLLGGDDYVGRIDKELVSAKSVIVLWSNDATKSRWVVGEAETAANSGKLVPVILSGVKPEQIPSAGLRVIQCVAYDDRDGVRRAVEAKLSRVIAPKAGVLDRVRPALLRQFRRFRRNATPLRLSIGLIFLLVLAGLTLDYIDWTRIDGSLSSKDYQDYLNAFPWPRLYSHLARARLSGEDEFAVVKTTSGLDRFVSNHPDSMYAPLARLRAQRLKQIETRVYNPVVPTSALEPIEAGNLAKLQCKDLWAARNEIFFRDGYCFTTEHAANYFKTGQDCPSRCDLKKSINRFISNKAMSEIELRNIDLLKARESELGCSELKAAEIPDC